MGTRHMNAPCKATVLWVIALIALGSTTPAVRADENFEAVSSKISPDYVREKLPNGSFKPEEYSFGKGGYWSGPMPDTSIDRMSFTDIIKVLAVALAQQRYVPSRDQKDTRLLIMVYWGTTSAVEKGSESIAYQGAEKSNEDVAMAENRLNADKMLPLNQGSVQQQIRTDQQLADIANNAFSSAMSAVQAENKARYLADLKIAELLGYDSWWESTMGAQDGTPLAIRRKDMLDELEHYRYFVVLMAYDFQLIAKEKKHKLLWETRFSIRQQNNQFDKQLASMVLQASQYFGRDSNGLTHKAIPPGHVEVKEPSLIELLDTK